MVKVRNKRISNSYAECLVNKTHRLHGYMRLLLRTIVVVIGSYYLLITMNNMAYSAESSHHRRNNFQHSGSNQTSIILANMYSSQHIFKNWKNGYRIATLGNQHNNISKQLYSDEEILWLLSKLEPNKILTYQSASERINLITSILHVSEMTTFQRKLTDSVLLHMLKELLTSRLIIFNKPNKYSRDVCIDFCVKLNELDDQRAIQVLHSFLLQKQSIWYSDVLKGCLRHLIMQHQNSH